MCVAVVEMTNHLLVNCRFADEVWEKVFGWCKVPWDIFLSVQDLLCVQDSLIFKRAELEPNLVLLSSVRLQP